MGALELRLGPPPAPPLSLNKERTQHWAKTRRESIEPWKEWMWAMAVQHRLKQRVRGRPCWVQFVLPFRDNRRRDPHNYVPVVKACIDGLVCANVWPDDTAEYVTIVDSQLVVGREVLLRIGLREEVNGTAGERSGEASV